MKVNTKYKKKDDIFVIFEKLDFWRYMMSKSSVYLFLFLLLSVVLAPGGLIVEEKTIIPFVVTFALLLAAFVFYIFSFARWQSWQTEFEMYSINRNRSKELNQ